MWPPNRAQWGVIAVGGVLSIALVRSLWPGDRPGFADLELADLEFILSISESDDLFEVEISDPEECKLVRSKIKYLETCEAQLSDGRSGPCKLSITPQHISPPMTTEESRERLPSLKYREDEACKTSSRILLQTRVENFGDDLNDND